MNCASEKKKKSGTIGCGDSLLSPPLTTMASSQSIFAQIPLYIPKEHLPSLPVLVLAALFGAPFLAVVLNVAYQLVRITYQSTDSHTVCGLTSLFRMRHSSSGRKIPVCLLSFSTTSHGSDPPFVRRALLSLVEFIQPRFADCLLFVWLGSL